MTARRHFGFTLIELLVVTAILATLIGLTLSAVQRVRATASRTACGNNLRQLGLGLHGYHDTYAGLPTGTVGKKGDQPFSTWGLRILPFVEQSAVWQAAQAAYRVEPDPFRSPPHTGLATVLKVFACTSDDRTAIPQTSYGVRIALSSYLGVSGTDRKRTGGVLYLNSRHHFLEATDGLSQTLLIGERPPSSDMYFGWWYAGKGQDDDGSCDATLGVRERNVWGSGPTPCLPGPYRFASGRIPDFCSVFHFWSLHPGGANFAFCDGSVRFLRYEADPIMPALASRAGGEVVTVPD